MTTPSRTKRLGYRVREFCDATGLGRTKVYELIAQKRLDVVRVGRCTIITADSVEALLQSKPALNTTTCAKQSEAGSPVKEGGQDA